MNDIDIDTIQRKLKLCVGVAVICALTFAVTLLLWMKSVDDRLRILNTRVETLEAMHGYAIDGATHDKHN